ncbi:LysR family transcriptional regulator [Pseudomonas mangiferae]|uniref:LysR family transcriptional regulator n=1 Tax=Pseudomonas mangiferae TaxID=2593654 RepID=A0A553H125_9PSED|nr:LysR family transcriptional regulator [Pseudomonas mangiferae]TRX75447.1 LysR family transcriptional regulator [Pseudomonas mangiferae]
MSASMERLSQLNLNHLYGFVAVVEHQSFTAAAEALGLSKSLLSEQLARLEASLGTQLLTRTTRRMALTDSGTRLFDVARRLLGELDSAVADVRDPHGEPSGRLRITAPLDFAKLHISAVAADYIKRFPKTQVEMIGDDQVLDLVGQRIDLAVRVGWPKDSGLHANKLATFEQTLVAAPDYLAQHPPLREPDDLARIEWIAHTRLASPWQWTFRRGEALREVRTHGRLQANTTLSVYRLVRAGAGLSVLPSFLVAGDLASGRLVRVLEDWSLPQGGIYALYPSARYMPARVRAFIHSLRERLDNDPFGAVARSA